VTATRTTPLGIEFQGTIAEARAFAKATSAADPGTYYTYHACFGLYLAGARRLDVFAPTDTPYQLRYYYLSGREKPFSEAQVVADQLATPVTR